MREDKLIELLIDEVRSVRNLIEDDRKERREEIKNIYEKINESNRDLNSLKTRFMIVAVTMGTAGGKLSSLIPFLR